MALVGGEAIEALQWEQLSGSQAVDFYNVYGPTECTVDATLAQLRAGEPVLHIGRPIANTRVYILDERGSPVAVGVTGELYIGGAGVARGYLNRPELTAERFVKDPFAAEPDARMYRTGDLGRWRADGTIEYQGRNDHQVKIRGFRIELGEIEAKLLGYSGVREAVVLAREDAPGEKRLVAYVVASEAEVSPGAEALRTYLKEQLPEHMVPSAYVVLESLPLTANGKLDRRALPAPDASAYITRGYEAPQGEVEEILAGIWQGLLKAERVGRRDNFFELGGHSLLIVQMLERLRRFGLQGQVRPVYESATLEELARTLVTGAAVEQAVPENLIPPGCERITSEMLPMVDLTDEQIELIVDAVPGGSPGMRGSHLSRTAALISCGNARAPA